MVCQSERAHRTVFFVPNDHSGCEFIKALRFYLNRKCHRIRLLGRNQDRSATREEFGGYRARSSPPFRQCSYFAVYIDSSSIERIAERHRDRLRDDIVAAQRELNRLRKEVGQEMDVAINRETQDVLALLAKRRILVK